MYFQGKSVTSQGIRDRPVKEKLKKFFLQFTFPSLDRHKHLKKKLLRQNILDDTNYGLNKKNLTKYFCAIPNSLR